MCGGVECGCFVLSIPEPFYTSESFYPPEPSCPPEPLYPPEPPYLVGAGPRAAVSVRSVQALLFAHAAQVPLAAVCRVVAGFSEDLWAGGYLAEGEREVRERARGRERDRWAPGRVRER